MEVYTRVGSRYTRSGSIYPCWKLSLTMEFITLSQEVYLLIFFTSALTQISYVSSQTTTQIDYVTSSAYTQCPVGESLCGDGSSCYYSVGRCDRIPDCNDGSDETNCPTNTLPPSCPEQQKKCPDGSCINPINDCPELSAITSALSSLDAQLPGTTETVLASSSSIVTSRSLLTDVELSTSVHSSSYSLTSKQTDVTSSLQTRPEEATRTHSEDIRSTHTYSEDIRSTHAYSEDIRSTRAYSEEFQSTRTYSEQIQLTQASKYQSAFYYNSFLSTDEVMSSMSSVHTSDTNDMPSVSSFTKTEFISPSVSITTQSSVFVTSDILPSSTIQFSAAIMSSSYINENVTSSFKWPLSTSSDNIKLSTSITDEITTPSLQTPSLTIKPTETVKTNSTILQSHTEDILPTKTIISLDTFSSIRMNATLTTPFSTITPPVDTPFPPWIIAVIVCGSVLVLFIIVCLYVVCSQKRKRTHKLPYKDPDDIGYRSSTVKRPIYDYHYDNRLIYQQPSIPRPIVDNYITARNLKNSDFRNINE